MRCRCTNYYDLEDAGVQNGKVEMSKNNFAFEFWNKISIG